MLESVLVADGGLGAARVLSTCRRLGIKSVLVRLSEETDRIVTDAAPAADDLVLLASANELADPVAVVRAAAAAGVQAIHPGYGPLRGDARLVQAATDAGLIAVVTTGVGPAGQIAHLLAQSIPPVPQSGANAPVTRWVYVLGAPSGAVVLGSVQASEGHVVAGALDGAEAADHRLAHAVAAVIGVEGLAAVGVGPDGVVSVVAGLPEAHAAWELVTDVDLVELQLLAAIGRSPLTARSDLPLSGVAIGLTGVDVVDDLRTLDGLAAYGLRLDTVALSGSAHGALVRVSAWGPDLAEAERVLADYVNRPR